MFFAYLEKKKKNGKKKERKKKYAGIRNEELDNIRKQDMGKKAIMNILKSNSTTTHNKSKQVVTHRDKE